MDHIIPKARGGSNEDSNFALACFKCNTAKGDLTPEEWRLSKITGKRRYLPVPEPSDG